MLLPASLASCALNLTPLFSVCVSVVCVGVFFFCALAQLLFLCLWRVCRRLFAGISPLFLSFVFLCPCVHLLLLFILLLLLLMCACVVVLPSYRTVFCCVGVAFMYCILLCWCCVCLLSCIIGVAFIYCGLFTLLVLQLTETLQLWHADHGHTDYVYHTKML